MTWTDQPDKAIRRAAAERVMGWASRGMWWVRPHEMDDWTRRGLGHIGHDYWQPDRDLNQLAQVFRAALNQHGQVEGAADLWLLAIEHPRRVLCTLLDALADAPPEEDDA